MNNQYENGEYWAVNSSFHEEDSDFKFQNFLTLLKRNPQAVWEGITDLGCGAGRIIWNFSNQYPQSKCLGLDLNPEIIAYADQKYQNTNLAFEVATKNIPADLSGLVILADVFEHAEDYLGLLKSVNHRFSYYLFNIPLDLSIRSLIRNEPIQLRKNYGHLHYFYDKLALQMLTENGFQVVDFLYADNVGFDYISKRGMSKFVYLLKLSFAKIFSAVFGKSRTSMLLGCYSLTVLCTNKSSV